MSPFATAIATAEMSGVATPATIPFATPIAAMAIPMVTALRQMLYSLMGASMPHLPILGAPLSFACFASMAADIPSRECSSGTRSGCERSQQGGPHSITSSARACKVGEIASPRCLAVFRFKTSCNRLGCWTGNSLGFSPFRIRSTYCAAPNTNEPISGP
jgi:hypothetical protein